MLLIKYTGHEAHSPVFDPFIHKETGLFEEWKKRNWRKIMKVPGKFLNLSLRKPTVLFDLGKTCLTCIHQREDNDCIISAWYHLFVITGIISPTKSRQDRQIFTFNKLSWRGNLWKSRWMRTSDGGIKAAEWGWNGRVERGHVTVGKDLAPGGPAHERVQSSHLSLHESSAEVWEPVLRGHSGT